MNGRRHTRWGGICSVLPAVLLLLLAAPGAAQEHDLVMFSLDVDPKPLERGCTASIVASFLINGHLDDQLMSGDAEMRFYWADGAAPVPTSPAGWSSIGTLPATWSASDGPFAIGREWPTGFPSVSGASQSWNVPAAGTTFHLKAEVLYTAAGVSDAVPANNVMVAANVPSVEGDCPSNQCCFTTASGFMVCNLLCLDPDIVLIPRERLICLIRPEVCQLPPIPICEIIDCNPCFFGLTCPPDPWDVLVRWPEEVMRVDLIAGGEVVARSERLRRPVERDGVLYHQVLRFTPKQGVEYGLRVKGGPKAEPGEVYPLELRAERELQKGAR